ncbi:MAG: hypothetical protein HFG51_06695 [Lachnospiraceae bacterium]|nr:hypothetical protein [Lachnospiraceae bacterium]
MKKTGLMVMGLAAVLGIGSAVGVCGGTKKIIKFEDGKRVEIDVENGGAAVGNEARSEAATEAADLSFGGAETDLDSAFTYTPETTEEGALGEEGILELGKFWGPVTEKLDGSFIIDSKVPDGYQGDIVIHIDPDNTLVLDALTGFPVTEGEIAAGQTTYVYTSPAMTMSLPPQTTAELVLVNVPQDAGAPLYVRASGALEADGAGGYVLKSTRGEEIKVPADCPITPFLTRQMVRLEDIAKGRKCLVWLGADGQAERIVLFNQ